MSRWINTYSFAIKKTASYYVTQIMVAAMVGEQAVAVVTQNSDGSYTIHCIVHSDGVVNAALASYFVTNKDAISKQKQQVGVAQAVATQDQQIAIAAQAANADKAVITA